MAIKTFKSFTDSIEANIVLSKLQANSIPCFLTNEHTNDLLWHMNIATGGIRLMLHDYDFERAREVLAYEPMPISNETQGTLQCPNCRSNNIKYGPQTQSKYSWWGLILSLLFVAPAPVIRKGFHCFNCGLDFRAET